MAEVLKNITLLWLTLGACLVLGWALFETFMWLVWGDKRDDDSEL